MDTFVDFSELDREFEFSDDLASESLVGQFLKINVKLVNVDGQESQQYTMNVQVMPAAEQIEQVQEEPEAFDEQDEVQID